MARNLTDAPWEQRQETFHSKGRNVISAKRIFGNEAASKLIVNKILGA